MSDQEKIKTEPTPPAGAPVPSEDSGSQALSEALRSSFFIVKIIMVGLVALFLCSGFFTVGPQSKAIILRFGKPVGEGERALLSPGFHWAFPAPIDEVTNLPVNQILLESSSVGWYATTPAAEAAHNEMPPGPSLNPASDGYALTSDTNIIHVRALLRYRVTDPIRFYFDFSNGPQFVTNALDNALLFTSAQFNVDDALTHKAVAFREMVAGRVRDLIEGQRLGISIEPPDVEVIPPRQLKAKFNEVLQASLKADEARNKAESYTNEILSKARAEFESRTNTAAVERSRLVQTVAAEAKQFADFLPQYQDNPEFFARLRQTEAMGRILANAQEKIFLPQRADGKPRELRLQLSREPQKPAAQTNP